MSYTRVSLENVEQLVSSVGWRARNRGTALYYAVDYLCAPENGEDRDDLLSFLLAGVQALYPTAARMYGAPEAVLWAVEAQYGPFAALDVLHTAQALYPGR